MRAHTSSFGRSVMSGKILPFQQLSTRKRKDVNEGTVTVQVCVFAFDILFLNGESLLKVPCVWFCVCVRERQRASESVRECVCACASRLSLSHARARSLSFVYVCVSLYLAPRLRHPLSCPASSTHRVTSWGRIYGFQSGLSRHRSLLDLQRAAHMTAWILTRETRLSMSCPAGAAGSSPRKAARDI